jgi:leader peptidase (prepilin peptidase) / N-methyltransferase
LILPSALLIWGLWILGGGLLGAIFGSFIGALCCRWPDGKSVSAGRSQCDGCGKILTVAELIPLLSFILQLGRCKTCGAKVDPVQFIAEISALLIGAGAFAFLVPPQAISFAIMGWILLPLMILDYRHLWLPNLLTIALALAGFLAGYFLNPAYNILIQISAAVTGFLALELLRRGFKWLRGKDGMGAGDPKLFGAIALWVSPLMLPYILLGASLLGLITFLTLPKDINKLTVKMPLGTMIAIAAITAMFAQLYSGIGY